MDQTYFPALSKMVPASLPHPPNTFYKISIGIEVWGANYVPVVKVQMAYGNKISEQSTPSYPLGTDDHIRVHRAIVHLIKKYETSPQVGK